MRAMLFHNPSAGTGCPSADELLDLLRNSGLSPSYCSTKDPAFKDRLREPAELVIAAGGDGTVGKVVTGLSDRNVLVGILPLGTANNIARSLGIAGSLEEIVAGWQAAGTRHLDIGSACGPWGRRSFVEAVGLGSLARAIARIDAAGLESFDGLRSGPGTFRAVLTGAEAIRMQIAVDGQPLDGDLLLVEVMNIGYAGPRLHLAPSADPGDGLLDVVHVRTSQRAEMLDWLETPERRPLPPVDILRGRKIALTCDGAPLRLDDHFPSAIERTGTITLELEAEPVRILVPPAARSGVPADGAP